MSCSRECVVYLQMWVTYARKKAETILSTLLLKLFLQIWCLNKLWYVKFNCYRFEMRVKSIRKYSEGYETDCRTTRPNSDETGEKIQIWQKMNMKTSQWTISIQCTGYVSVVAHVSFIITTLNTHWLNRLSFCTFF